MRAQTINIIFNSEKKLKKARNNEADALILDLEDWDFFIEPRMEMKLDTGMNLKKDGSMLVMI